MTRDEAIINLKLSQNRIGGIKKEEWNALQMAIEALSADAAQEAVPTVVRVTMSDGSQYYLEHERDALQTVAVQGWIPLSHDDDGLGTDFPYERDGEWVIVTDGKNISVERIKKDAYDHFFPNGRWFELEEVVAWRPLPTPYKGGDTK